MKKIFGGRQFVGADDGEQWDGEQGKMAEQ